MGIRYYAYPVASNLIEVAKSSPRSFLSDDPLTDAWRSVQKRPRMLYLDKCWHELQIIFGLDDASPRRPAFALVDGNVTYINEGWISHVAVLDSAQVAEVSKDLASITPSEVRDTLIATHTFGPQRDLEAEIEYVTHYLADALTFTTSLAEHGDGLVYLIG
jgi:hypothetical protein